MLGERFSCIVITALTFKCETDIGFFLFLIAQLDLVTYRQKIFLSILKKFFHSSKVFFPSKIKKFVWVLSQPNSLVWRCQSLLPQACTHAFLFLFEQLQYRRRFYGKLPSLGFLVSILCSRQLHAQWLQAAGLGLFRVPVGKGGCWFCPEVGGMCRICSEVGNQCQFCVEVRGVGAGSVLRLGGGSVLVLF